MKARCITNPAVEKERNMHGGEAGLDEVLLGAEVSDSAPLLIIHDSQPTVPFFCEF